MSKKTVFNIDISAPFKMTWRWELFDKRNMTSYLRSVREISDKMIKAGNGSFEIISIFSGSMESYGVKCGKTYFIF